MMFGESECHGRELSETGATEEWNWSGFFDCVSSITWLSLAQKFLLHRHSGLRPRELPAS